MSEQNIIKAKRFCESLETDVLNAQFLTDARKSTYIRKVMKEMTYGDAAPALGDIADRVLGGFYANAVGRRLCMVVETMQPKVRFFKVLAGNAGRFTGDAPPALLAGAPTYVDVDADIELGTRIEYALSAIEDIPVAVRQQVESDAGRAVAISETAEVKAVLDAIAAGDLAGGAAQTPKTGDTFVYEDVLKLLGVLQDEGAVQQGSTLILVANPAQFGDALLADDKFINSQYKTAAELTDWPNSIGMDVYNIVYLISGCFTAATVYLLNKDYALGLPLRRDVSIKPFERNLVTGTDVHERIGVKVVNTKAVAKMTGC